MSMCSVFMRAPSLSLRSSLDRRSRRRPGQQPLRQPLELVAPPGVVGARQAAQLDAYRTRGLRAGHDPNPDPAPAHHQRHQQPGHHRQREHQHPHLGGVVGDLHVDERHRAVEPDDGAVVEPGLLAGAQVDPRLLGEPVLVDEPRVQREQRLRPPGVQPGVAAVDVDGHGRVVQRREARRQQRAVELLGRREQALDGDLVLAALVGIGVGAAGRVDADHARRQQGHRVVGPPLQRLGAGLPVGEGDGERRGVAVALQVHPVAADAQRLVDLEPVRPPGVGVQVGAGLVVDVGGERDGLPGRQVVRLEVVDPQADRVQRRAVDGVAGPERVERGGRRRAEAGTAVGDDDDVALVAEQLSGGHRDEQAEQREVEDDVAELAQIALLRGDLSDVVVVRG